MAPEEFVALALAQPINSGRAQFGYAMRVASGNPNPPGLLALTWITGKDASERERIRAYARKSLEDFLAQPGFISIVTGFIGLRGFTVTAWEHERAMKQALGKSHAVAMRALFGENFVASVWTSVWTPGRLNRMWMRCIDCGTLVDVSENQTACQVCQARLPDRPAFW